jgi:hypothetical protein
MAQDQQNTSAHTVPKRTDDNILFRNMPPGVRQLQAQARRELRLKQRAQFKAKYLS